MPLHDLRCSVCSSVEQDVFCKDADKPSLCPQCGGSRRVFWGATRAPHFAGQLLVENPYGPGQVTQAEAIEAVAARRGVDPSTLTVAKVGGDRWNEKADKLRQEQLNVYRRRGYDERDLARLRRESQPPRSAR